MTQRHCFEIVVASVLLLVSLGCTCPQGGNEVFLSDFDSDTLGGLPSTAGPFGPPGAALVAAGELEVVQPAALTTRAVRMDRPNFGETRLAATLGGPVISSGKAVVVFDGYGEIVPAQLIAGMEVRVLSSDDEAAAVLKLFDGSYKVLEGALTVDIAGSYNPSVAHTVVITLDLDTQTFSVCLGASELLSGRPFASSAGADIERVEFLMPATLTEAFPSVFVLDRIRMAY